MCQALTPQDQLSERLFHSTIHALELFGIYIGRQLGLYQALTQQLWTTPSQLSSRAKIAERYAQEWLEQQAVAGLLTVRDAARPRSEREYRLPDDHYPVLVDADHLAHVAPFAEMVVGIAGALPRVVEAYQNGTGVPYSAYGNDFRMGQGGINRPAFRQELPHRWLAALPELHARLRAGEAVSVLDLGCGEGWASIALASHYPNARVVGVDADDASIATARRHADVHGASVEFICADATELPANEPFDLILILETLHDLPHPRAALRAARRVLAPSGSLLVADERVAETFVAPGDEIERMMYGWSIAHCLPTSMMAADSAAIGTAIRPEVVETLSRSAGFGGCQPLEIQNDLFRFWRLTHGPSWDSQR